MGLRDLIPALGSILPQGDRAKAALKWVVRASILLGIIQAAAPFLQRALYDHVLPNHAGSSLAAVGFLMVCYLATEFGLSRARLIASEAVRASEEVAGKKAIIAKALRAKPELVPPQKVRDALRHSESIREMRSGNVVFNLLSLPFALLSLIAVAVVAGPGWVIVFVPFFAMVIAAVLGAMTVANTKAAAHAVTEAYAIDAKATEEVVQTMDGLRLLGAGECALNRLDAVADASAEVGAKLRETSGLSSSAGASLAQFGSFATMIVGAILVFDGSLTMGALIAASIFGGKAIQPFAGAAAVAAALARGLEAEKALSEFMSLPEQVPATPSYLPEASGSLDFSSVQHQYQGSTINSLDGLNLKIPAGARIAIVGKNGSGKSTLWKVLTGLVEQQSGVVSIDGVNVAALDRKQLREIVGVVEQRPAIISGSLLDNLKLGNPNVSDQQVQSICEALGLAEWIKLDGRGLQMPLSASLGGDSGISAGRLQQVAIARLMLRNPKVVVLDEFTANLDLAAEARIVGCIREWLKGRTAIVITHKPQLAFPEAGLVDQIVEIDGGKVTSIASTADYRARFFPAPKSVQRAVKVVQIEQQQAAGGTR